VVMRWLAGALEVRVREPELTVQCRGRMPWRRGSGTVGDASVAVRGVGVAHLGLRVVQHDVGRDPATVPLAALDVVQPVDARVLAGVVRGVARHVDLGAVRDVTGAVAGASVAGVGAEVGVAEDLHAVAVVDHVLDGVGVRVVAPDRVAALVGGREGAAARTVDVVHVVAVGLASGTTAGGQQRSGERGDAGEQDIPRTERVTRRSQRGRLDTHRRFPSSVERV